LCERAGTDRLSGRGTTDGGATWEKPIALPKELKGVSPLTWLDTTR
jgi:hypothetical protein